MHYSWLCGKCDEPFYSAAAMRNKEKVMCPTCGAENINPYYTGGEDGEAVSADSADDISQK